MGAAASYAAALDPETASGAVAVAADDLYPLVTIKFDTPSLAYVQTNSRLRLTVSCGEEVGLNFAAFVRVGTGLKLIGSRFLEHFLTAAGTRSFVMTVDPTLLQGKRSASIHIQATGSDGEGYRAVASASTVLR